ncbi:NADH:flavin oxidoreductase [Pseudomonas japonica]|uniref:NADH:flavin oxidoreductase n=1 Tax=Pseudomonas TaxID=286 RepID=UPI00292A380F|nr:NADH:flavin oxidoreductase [Pseudomonas sp. zfem002]MDU9393296.1 NADH:flavin oxidoreductase [Pseudomonas sp. zfem002]
MNPIASPSRALFTPVSINRLTLSNRLVLAPMAVLCAEADGAPSAQTIAFLEARARGGVGLIIASGCASQRCADEYASPMLRFDIEAHVPRLKQVAAAVHAHGVPIFAQLTAAFGRMGSPKSPQPLISASARHVAIPEHALPKGLKVPGGLNLPEPREASVEQIQALGQACIDAALRARRAGWDGVEIPAHGSYFLASFLSPWSNWRTDAYGGSPENRARAVVEIVRGIRAQAGPDFPIGLRISCDEPVEGGQSPAEFVRIARLIVEAGADYVALLDGCSEQLERIFSARDGGMLDSGAARLFKQALPVPVLLQGLHDPDNAARAIAEGHGDLVLLGRPLLADPDWPNKVRQGQASAIVVCNRDNHCLHRTLLNLPAQCPLNPEFGNESRQRQRTSPLRRLVTRAREGLTLGLSGCGPFMRLVSRLMLRRKP